MKKSWQMSIRGSGKGEGGDTIPVVLRTKEYIVIFLYVEIITVPCVILSRSVRLIDLLGHLLSIGGGSTTNS